MTKKKFIDSKSALRFQLVHRSQRDPLIVDDNASGMVLKAIDGKTRNEIEHTNLNEEVQEKLDHGKEEKSKFEEAANYGIYFNDTEYNYMQHLKAIGNSDAVFIPTKNLVVPEKKMGIVLPKEALPSRTEEKIGLLNRVAYNSQWVIEEEDPDVWEVLESLEREDFEEKEKNEFPDDFITLLNSDQPAQQFSSQKKTDNQNMAIGTTKEVDHSTLDAFHPLRFKQMRQALLDHSSDDANANSNESDDIDSAEEEEVKSQFTEYSMTSASLPRTKELKTLDDRFEKLIAREYNDQSEEEEEGTGQADIEAFESILDEFLSKQPALLGNRLESRLDIESIRSYLRGTAPTQAMLNLQYERENLDSNHSYDEDAAIERAENLELIQDQDQWDCKSILSTYSNLENHPYLIHEYSNFSRPINKIHIDERTGLPKITLPRQQQKLHQAQQHNVSSSSSIQPSIPSSSLHFRPLNESNEEKRDRKQNIKLDRRQKRADKKTTKLAFKHEKLRQEQLQHNQRHSLPSHLPI